MLRRTKITVIAGVAAAGLAAGGATAAAAVTNGSTGGTGTPVKAHRAALLSRVEHGQVTLRGNRTVDLQSGVIEKVSGSSLTVRSRDGYSHTYALGAQSRVRKDGKSANAKDLAAKDRVIVRAVVHGSSATVRHLIDRGPAKH